MAEFYSCAHLTDKKRVAGTLLGGSVKRLTASGEYIGMPTAVNSLDTDEKIVTDASSTNPYMTNAWQNSTPTLI